MTLVDNNVLSSLAKIERLSMLDDAYEEVLTTASVLDELHSDSVSGHTFVDRIDEIKRYEGGWLEIVSPTDAEVQLTEEILDSSLTYTDAELIAIAEHRTERLLTDDRYVGEVASRRGVETWDLVLLLRTACEAAAIETSAALRTVIEELRREDYYEFSDEDERYLFDYF